ncbi:hypothetical protein CRM81_05490 [Yersinia kristensenii]|nr:hypothetical protein ykris0001_2820 [Yersinia kristensenii ATCC 33638]PEH52850.1 hypothetical protein CRM81_05490 [Yersinia kristensenii]SUP70710.1 Uncharacterised protein [Yersinia kristensenii]
MARLQDLIVMCYHIIVILEEAHPFVKAQVRYDERIFYMTDLSSKIFFSLFQQIILLDIKHFYIYSITLIT